MKQFFLETLELLFLQIVILRIPKVIEDGAIREGDVNGDFEDQGFVGGAFQGVGGLFADHERRN